MLFDSHAHVDGPEFDGDREDVLARARAAGVQRIVVIGAVGDTTSAGIYTFVFHAEGKTAEEMPFTRDRVVQMLIQSQPAEQNPK